MRAARHQAFIMDCCYGGLLGRAGSTVPQNIPNYIGVVGKRPAQQILTAEGKNETVVDGGPGGHSVFTGYLLKGLRDGFADTNMDGWVTFIELVNYIEPAATTSSQTPGYDTLPGHEQGDFIWKPLKTLEPIIVKKASKPPEPITSRGVTPTLGVDRTQNTFLTKLGIQLVSIKGGTFEMGDQFGDGEADEKPVHTVTLSDYHLSETEVTVGQFRRFVDNMGYRTTAEKDSGAYVWAGKKWEKKKDANWKNPYFEQSDNHPVTCVSWVDAVEFCKWLSHKSGRKVRLPTEAEWEYAARNGGKKVKFPWGNTFDASKLNYADVNTSLSWSDASGNDGYKNTAPVGSFAPNELGLYDMAGNVWEWCADWYGKDYYRTSPEQNPKGPDSGSFRLLRGGGWYINTTDCRASYRNRYNPQITVNSNGFRVCVSPR